MNLNYSIKLNPSNATVGLSSMGGDLAPS